MSDEGVPFDDDEDLYRRLESGWVLPDGQIAAAAIDLQGTSVDRGARSTIDECFARRRPSETAVAAIKYSDALQSFPHPDPEVAGFCTRVWPCSEGDNPAHCEIRVHQDGHPGSDSRPPGHKQLRAKIKAELAARMRLVKPPVHSDEDEF